MKDIFANLYNKVVSFFHQTDNNEGSNAKEVACNRLKLVLMQDRTNLTPAIMDRMRKELIGLLSKYLELDNELLDLNFEHEDNQMALMLSIPVIRAKSEEEIQEILDKEDAQAEEENEEEDDKTDSEDSEDESEEVEESESDEEAEPEQQEEEASEEVEEKEEKKAKK